MNSRFQSIVFWVAVAGWGIALAAHGFSVAGVDLQTPFPPIFLLHLGIFFVTLPTILYLRSQNSKSRGNWRLLSTLKTIWQSTPRAITLLVVAGWLYGFSQFPLGIGKLPGTPDIRQGKYVLHNRGMDVQEISQAEFHQYKAYQLRSFSAVWIVFYGVGAVVLYPFKKRLPKEPNLTEA